MKRIFLYLLLFIACQQNTSTNILYSSEFDGIQYFGEDSFLLEGTDIPDSLKENKYDRLPISYKDLVREPVSLYRHSLNLRREVPIKCKAISNK